MASPQERMKFTEADEKAMVEWIYECLQRSDALREHAATPSGLKIWEAFVKTKRTKHEKPASLQSRWSKRIRCRLFDVIGVAPDQLLTVYKECSIPVERDGKKFLAAKCTYWDIIYVGDKIIRFHRKPDSIIQQALRAGQKDREEREEQRRRNEMASVMGEERMEIEMEMEKDRVHSLQSTPTKKDGRQFGNGAVGDTHGKDGEEEMEEGDSTVYETTDDRIMAEYSHLECLRKRLSGIRSRRSVGRKSIKWPKEGPSEDGEKENEWMVNRRMVLEEGEEYKKIPDDSDDVVPESQWDDERNERRREGKARVGEEGRRRAADSMESMQDKDKSMFVAYEPMEDGTVEVIREVAEMNELSYVARLDSLLANSQNESSTQPDSLAQLDKLLQGVENKNITMEELCELLDRYVKDLSKESRELVEKLLQEVQNEVGQTKRNAGEEEGRRNGDGKNLHNDEMQLSQSTAVPSRTTLRQSADEEASQTNELSYVARLDNLLADSQNETVPGRTLRKAANDDASQNELSHNWTLARLDSLFADSQNEMLEPQSRLCDLVTLDKVKQTLWDIVEEAGVNKILDESFLNYSLKKQLVDDVCEKLEEMQLSIDDWKKDLEVSLVEKDGFGLEMHSIESLYGDEEPPLEDDMGEDEKGMRQRERVVREAKKALDKQFPPSDEKQLLLVNMIVIHRLHSLRFEIADIVKEVETSWWDNELVDWNKDEEDEEEEEEEEVNQEVEENED